MKYCTKCLNYGNTFYLICNQQIRLAIQNGETNLALKENNNDTETITIYKKQW